MAIKLAVSSYSFWRWPGQKPAITEMIDLAARFGFDGIEILAEDLPDRAPAALSEVRRHAALKGVSIVTVSDGENFVHPDAAERAKRVDGLRRTIDVATHLGASFVRVLGGVWGTGSVQDLIDNDGEERPAEGHTVDEGYAWSIDCLTQGAAYAGEKGVILVLENHWGLTSTADGVLRIFNGVDSPNLKIVLDTGNYIHRPDPYAEMTKVLPHLALVHAKTYEGGPTFPFVKEEMDNPRIVSMLRESGYNGFLSMEFEGAADPHEGIPAGAARLREALAGEPTLAPNPSGS